MLCLVGNTNPLAFPDVECLGKVKLHSWRHNLTIGSARGLTGLIAVDGKHSRQKREIHCFPTSIYASECLLLGRKCKKVQFFAGLIKLVGDDFET